MDSQMKQGTAVIALLASAGLVTVLAGTFAPVAAQHTVQQYTAQDVLAAKPLGQEVQVTGTVTRTAPDYVSNAGNTYQRFYIGRSLQELLVFCSTRAGRVQVAAGDRVRVTGEFKNYYGTYEIYTACNRVEPE